MLLSRVLPERAKLTSNKKPSGSPDIRFSAKDSADIANYTEKDYNTYGWARVSGVISAGENIVFRGKVAERKNGASFPRTSDGKYLISASEASGKQRGVDNVVIVTDGKFGNWSIDRVYRIELDNETDIDRLRREIYEREEVDGARAGDIITNYFGEELVKRYRLDDFATYSEVRASQRPRNAGSRSEEDNRHYRFEQDGSGDRGETQDTDKIKFSFKDDLPNINTEELRDTMEYDDQSDSVRAAAEITNGYKASDSVVDRIATATLRETMSTYDKDKLTAALREVFTNIGVASDEAFEYLTRVAKDILMKSSEIDRELSARNKEIRSLVRNAKIRLTEVQRKNVEYAYGSYNAYRKQHGLFNVTDKGMYLDQLWASWSEAFPDVFDADMGEGDMPFAIREILTRYQNHYSNPYGFGMDESASYYAMRMLDQFFSTQEIKHFAGARAVELKAITDKYEQRIKSVREQSRKRADERIAKIKAANRDRLNLISREYAKAKKEQRRADREKFLDEYKKLTDSKPTPRTRGNVMRQISQMRRPCQKTGAVIG
ncbi:MAG: hypothetical protein Q4E65_08440 [Clostridia bacterium]|nr:hypothetical protein [Clostridia bacterium]